MAERHPTDMTMKILAHYPSGGKVLVYNSIDRSTSDFKRIFDCAKFFAHQGKTVILPPKLDVPYKNPAYDQIYGTLKDTAFYGKCPDLQVDGVWYEHEGYATLNPKTNFSNMLKRGLRQSDRIIIEDCALTDSYMKRNILVRISENQCIKEVYVKMGCDIRLLFKAV